MKILLVDKDNNLLLDYEDLKGIANNTINVALNHKGIVIQLLNDYKSNTPIKLGVDKKGELLYKQL